MRLISILPCVALLALTACDKSQPTSGANPKANSPETAAQPAPEATAKVVEKSETNAATVVAPKGNPAPYRLLGILDPDRNQMVAFALKVPTDWQVRQSMHRKWDGAVGLPQVSLTLRSPDGRTQIDYLPSSQYIFSEGPMASNLRAQKQAMGLPTQASPNELAPMSPTDYLRQILIPDLARNGVTLTEVGNEKSAPETTDENGQRKFRGSLDAKMPNGNSVRVEVRLNISSRQIGSDMYHSWSVVPSITQTAGDLESAHAHTRIAQESIVPNPEWMKIEQESQARGYAANREASARQHEATMANIRATSEAMTRAHNQRMADIRSFGEANTARFNQRMADMDRDQRVRVDTIRGETRYADPTTGERVKVADGFNHVYRNQQNPNLYYGTDTPIDSTKVDWLELQKVQLKDY